MLVITSASTWRSAGVTPEVNLRNPLALKLRADIARSPKLAAATAQTRPSNGVPVAGLGGHQVGERPIVLRQLLLW